MMKAFPAALAVAAVLIASANRPPASAEPLPGRVNLSYKVYTGGLLVALSTFEIDLAPDRIGAEFAVAPRGLPALFTAFDLHSRVDGRWNGGDIKPERYRNEYWKEERLRRWVEIDYAGNPTAEVQAVPTPAEDERPEVPEALRVDTLDPLSAALVLSRTIAGSGRCAGETKVYDGRRLFRVALEHVGMTEIKPSPREAYHGPAMKCRMALEKVTGFEDDELESKQYPESFEVLVAPVVPGGPWFPVRLRADYFIGKLVIKLVAAEGEGFEGQRANGSP